MCVCVGIPTSDSQGGFRRRTHTGEHGENRHPLYSLGQALRNQSVGLESRIFLKPYTYA